MRPRFHPADLKKAKPWEYALRFAFGGLVTVGAGLVARRWGPSIGGLFLAFPSILPAALTLVKQHDGRNEAVDDARGATLGAIALAGFAVVVRVTAGAWTPAVCLAVATAAWLLLAVVLWGMVYGREKG